MVKPEDTAQVWPLVVKEKRCGVALNMQMGALTMAPYKKNSVTRKPSVIELLELGL